MGYFFAKTYKWAFCRVFKKNPRNAPLYVLPQSKKIISRTFKIRGALVFLCPDERQRERESERERERERRGERE